jgi:hypothetical protein
MATSTILSLLYVPVAYTYFDSLSALFGKVFGFKLRLPFLGRSSDRDRRSQRRQLAPLPVAGGTSVAVERVQAARGGQRRMRRALAAR